MIHDAACVSTLAPASAAVERKGIYYTSARWTPDGLASLAAHLDAAGGEALATLPRARLLDAWCTTIGLFRDPRSAESEALRSALTRFSGLSAPALGGALEAVLGGVDRPAATALAKAARQDMAQAVSGRGLVAVFLASNLPALAVQPLLPALILGRPVLLKSPTREPLFAPAFVRALCRVEPALETAVAAVTWPGGDLALEAPVLERAETVLAYGEEPAIDSIAARARGTCLAYGPKTSLASVGTDADPRSIAAGLARDIALFDQRGCLSIQAIYTEGDPEALAQALAGALAEQARHWPAGDLDPIAVAGVQQLRLDARLRGLTQPEMPLAQGTVVIDPVPDFRPSPGLRSVRIHPLSALSQLPPLLGAWEGRLQGAALAGENAWSLAPALTALGVSRCAPPGRLQEPDALWHNGGVHPLEALAGPPPAPLPDTDPRQA